MVIMKVITVAAGYMAVLRKAESLLSKQQSVPPAIGYSKAIKKRI